MLSMLVLTMAYTSSSNLSADQWPPTDRKDLERTAFVVHRIFDPTHAKPNVKKPVAGYLVRGGRAFTIGPFDTGDRQKRGQKPWRLAVLDGDRFWLADDTYAEISRIDTKGVISDSERVGPDFWKPRLEHIKNYAAMTPQQNEAVCYLVRSAQNSKAIWDESRPGFLLPIADEVVVPGSIEFRFWSAGKHRVASVSASYLLARDKPLELYDAKAPNSGSGMIKLSRVAVLQALAKHYGSSEQWVKTEIPIRVTFTDSTGLKYHADLSLADPAEEKKLTAGASQLRHVLQERASTQRDIDLSIALSNLSGSPSIAIAILVEHCGKGMDQAAMAFLTELCDDFGFPVRAVLSR